MWLLPLMYVYESSLGFFVNQSNGLILGKHSLRLVMNAPSRLFGRVLHVPFDMRGTAPTFRSPITSLWSFRTFLFPFFTLGDPPPTFSSAIMKRGPELGIACLGATRMWELPRLYSALSLTNAFRLSF